MSTLRCWPFWIVCLVAFLCACGTDEPSNEPPTITVDVGTSAAYVVGEDSVRIEVTAQDPEGKSIDFSVVNKPDRADFQTFATSALFVWDPITSDVTPSGLPLELIFVAEDDQGATDEWVVNVTIRPGNGVPRFLTATSKIYDSSSEQPLSFDVEVRDDDSNEVQLSMTDAPDGASFEQTGVKTGAFLWELTDEQRNTRVHSVTFVANDRQNDSVTHKVTIIVQGGTGGGGDGDPDPTQSCEDQPISHVPIGAQRTVQDFEIEASFSTSAAAKYDAAYLFWTTGEPMNDADIQYESAEMKIDGTELRAAIPNMLPAVGQSEIVYYAICATDQDAAGDEPDSFICAPGNFDYSFVAYSPDESSCADDTAAGAGFSSASTAPDTHWGEYRTCSGTSDYHEVTVTAGETVEVYLLYSFGQDLDVALYDDAHKQRDGVTFSECHGIAVASLEGPESGEQTWFLEVKGDDTPYLLTAWREGGGGGQCGDEHLEPNDTESNAVLVFEDSEQFDGLSICEEDDVDIFGFDMLAGDQVEIDLAFTHADGDIDASLFAPGIEPTMDNWGVADGWSTDDNEHISYTAEESGIYHLLVMTTDTPNSYDLGIAETCVDDDKFGSQNRGQNSAKWIEAGSHENLKLCRARADWYERIGLSGEEVLVELEVIEGARLSDVDLSVYNSSGRLQTANEVNGSLELYFTPPSSDDYYYKVNSTKSMTYNLTLYD